MSVYTDIVYSLNCEYYELTKIDEILPFTFISTGFVHSIQFMGEVIWNDEDYERPQDDETGEYLQTIEEYCIQEAKKVLNSLLPILNWSK